MNTTSWNTRDLDDGHSQQDSKSAYTCGVRRAATITVTGYTSPRLIHHRKMDRPSSQGVDTQIARGSWAVTPQSYGHEKINMDHNPRPRSMIILPKDDPFVVDHSDNTESIESSDNGDSAQSDSGRDTSNTEPSTPSTERVEPVVLAKRPTSSQEILESFPVPKPRPISMSVVPAATRSPVSNGALTPRASPLPTTQTPRSYRLTPPRIRPASVAIMNSSVTTPASQPTTPTRFQYTPRSPQPFRSGSPTRQLPTPVATSPVDPQTPSSMMRRLSRRLSATPTELSTPKSHRHSSYFESPTKPSSLSRTSSFRQTGGDSARTISLKNGISDMSSISPVALPSTEQLANLERRNLQQHTQIMRTPPQIRARNATAPRAASGARRYGMFPEFDALDGDGFRLTEEDDTMIETSAPAMIEVPVAVETVDQSIFYDEQPTIPVPEAPPAQSPLGRQSTLRRSATKRMSMLGSRFSSSATDDSPKPTETNRSKKREKKGGLCIIM